MNKMKNFAKKIGLTAFAVMALPLAAMAEEPASADDSLVAIVDFTSVQSGIVTVAGGLIAIYLGLLAFRFLKGMVSRG